MTEKIMIGIITFVFGAVVTHLWDKVRKRIVWLKYTVLHHALGASAQDAKFGSVKLLYNDTPVVNLFMSTIMISNENSSDLSNIDLNIVCDQESLILISHGRNMASSNELQLTANYASLLSNAKQENLGYLFTRRDYKIPVLNRGDKIEFALVTTNPKGKQPYLTVNCDHAGVKMRQVPKFQELFGEPLPHSALIGAIIAVTLCLPAVCFIESKAVLVGACVGFGLFASLLGVLAIKVWKFLWKLLC